MRNILDIFEIRIHGRGGQGSVTAAELIAQAAFYEGRYSQAFPNFGVERRGAPVEAFARISDHPIRLRAQVYAPDFVIVQDPTLLNAVDVFSGLKAGGGVLINSEHVDLGGVPTKNCHIIPVTKLAIEILGRPVANTGLLAAFAKITGLIKFDSLERAVREQFADKPDLIDKNIELMKVVNKMI
jgi:pyruvate ferredoxin oxidoreductase gamma subunit